MKDRLNGRRSKKGTVIEVKRRSKDGKLYALCKAPDIDDIIPVPLTTEARFTNALGNGVDRMRAEVALGTVAASRTQQSRTDEVVPLHDACAGRVSSVLKIGSCGAPARSSSAAINPKDARSMGTTRSTNSFSTNSGRPTRIERFSRFWQRRLRRTVNPPSRAQLMSTQAWASIAPAGVKRPRTDDAHAVSTVSLPTPSQPNATDSAHIKELMAARDEATTELDKMVGQWEVKKQVASLCNLTNSCLATNDIILRRAG